jgi:sirohydrochlorin ferrochelatase
MAVRRTVEDLTRGVYLEEPDGPLLEESQILYVEASRTVDEAEARLPRVELSLGDRAASGRAAVEHLREALSHLRAYATQSGEGETWRMEELDAARGSFETAQEDERRFLKKARR